ncbi:hypothetical protein [Nocardia rhamnosiphila]
MNTSNHIGPERAGIASRTENPRAAGLIDAHTADFGLPTPHARNRSRCQRVVAEEVPPTT